MRQQNTNCHDIITSEEYVDLLKKIPIFPLEEDEQLVEECVQELTNFIRVNHVMISPENCNEFYFTRAFEEIPEVFTLTSISSIEAAGIGPVLKSKALNLTGNGVLVAVIDTGIDYMHKAFIYEDDTSKIVSIWDQTQEGNPPEGFLYGSEYTNEQINEAIISDNPLSVVPSVDEIGHGTFLAGIAAGRPNKREKFQGAAPDAELIIVKLKQAKKCLRDFFQVMDDAIAFQSNDIIQGLNYVVKKARSLKKPVVVLFAGASTMGAHEGTTLVARTFAKYGERYGVVTVLAAGNEANAGHHYAGMFVNGKRQVSLQMNIPENTKGVFMQLWSKLPDQVTIELISPNETSTGKIPFRPREWQEYTFIIEDSVISVWYDFVERSEEESISIIIQNPLDGLWTMRVYGDIIVNGQFDIYLPAKGLINDRVVFLEPSPFITVVNPANNIRTITVGAYNEIFNSIYIPSSRGFTKSDEVKPDFVAPGVNVIGPYPRDQYGTLSGTSVSAAITAGASALLLEWGIVKGNDEYMNTIAVKGYLSRGARRREIIQYPNREWGFGELDLFNTFSIIR